MDSRPEDSELPESEQPARTTGEDGPEPGRGAAPERSGEQPESRDSAEGAETSGDADDGPEGTGDADDATDATGGDSEEADVSGGADESELADSDVVDEEPQPDAEEEPHGVAEDEAAEAEPTSGAPETGDAETAEIESAGEAPESGETEREPAAEAPEDKTAEREPADATLEAETAELEPAAEAPKDKTGELEPADATPEAETAELEPAAATPEAGDAETAEMKPAAASSAQPEWPASADGEASASRSDAPPTEQSPSPPSASPAPPVAPAAPAAAPATGGPPAPPQDPPAASGASRRKLVGIGAGVLALAIALPAAGVLGLAAFTNREPEPVTEPAAASAPAVPSEEASTTPSATTPADPAEALEALRQESLDEARSQLSGGWVTQLSSKNVGLEAEGQTWDEAAILEDFENYKSRYPNAILLWSGDWSTYEGNNFWVVVLGESYSDPEEALGVCRSDGLDRNSCAAKWLSETDPPENSTRYPD